MWPNSDQLRPNSAKAGAISARFGPDSARIRPSLAEFGLGAVQFARRALVAWPKLAGRFAEIQQLHGSSRPSDSICAVPDLRSPPGS